ncbi:unnamed protein product [Didymodactylos carnosus]|uniref:Uncharacterized protein n=1 Tax=Didymodactylos carnosus TaxID=1234261 RepID=A0A8S2E294_9BILA|nr:unnamed protein product [Didymodactylos carnosus]CAF3883243.1 unnamed protein product [Didymodactylos carnosus]
MKKLIVHVFMAREKKIHLLKRKFSNTNESSLCGKRRSQLVDDQVTVSSVCVNLSSMYKNNINNSFIKRKSSPLISHRRAKSEIWKWKKLNPSVTSLGIYLNQLNLSMQDVIELKHALATIVQIIILQQQQQQQTLVAINENQKMNSTLKRRLTSPYLNQEKIDNDSDECLPIYTDDFYIRNGLLNHNNGPEIHDSIYSIVNPLYNSNYLKPIIHRRHKSLMSCQEQAEESTSATSLELTNNNRDNVSTLLTSNFYNQHQSEMQRSLTYQLSTLIDEHNKDLNNDIDNESTIQRTNKVKRWERKMPQYMKNRKYHTYTVIKKRQENVSNIETSLVSVHQNSNNTLITIESSLPSISQKETEIVETNNYFKSSNTRKSQVNKLFDNLFPMVRALAPLIIVRDKPFLLKNYSYYDDSLMHTSNLHHHHQHNSKTSISSKYLLQSDENLTKKSSILTVLNNNNLVLRTTTDQKKELPLQSLSITSNRNLALFDLPVTTRKNIRSKMPLVQNEIIVKSVQQLPSPPTKSNLLIDFESVLTVIEQSQQNLSRFIDCSLSPN